MRKLLALALLGLFVWGCSSGEVKCRTEQELLNHYVTYQRHRNLEGIMRLFYQKDTPQFVLDSVRTVTMRNFNYKIDSAEVADIPPEKLEKMLAGFPYNGKLLVPNLKPLKQIVLKYDLSGQPAGHQARGSSIMLGKEGEYYYLVLSKIKPQPKVVVKVQ